MNIRSAKNDPYRDDEADPKELRALHSCLWEIEIIMKQHFASKVRDYAKIFKTDLNKKTSYFKSEEFTVADSLELLSLDLNEVDEKTEAKAFKKNLLGKHGQSSVQLGLIGQKRTQDMVEDCQGYGYRDQTEGYKIYKYGEEFEDVHDILSLHHNYIKCNEIMLSENQTLAFIAAFLVFNLILGFFLIPPFILGVNIPDSLFAQLFYLICETESVSRIFSSN